MILFWCCFIWYTIYLITFSSATYAIFRHGVLKCGVILVFRSCCKQWLAAYKVDNLERNVQLLMIVQFEAVRILAVNTNWTEKHKARLQWQKIVSKGPSLIHEFCHMVPLKKSLQSNYYMQWLEHNSLQFSAGITCCARFNALELDKPSMYVSDIHELVFG